MGTRKPQFPAQIWDGTAADRDSRLIDASPFHPSYDQVVAELIATQQYAKSLVSVSEAFELETVDTLVPGNPVYIDGSGRLQLASYDTVATAQVAGLATQSAGPLTSGSYVTDDIVEMLDWTAIAGTHDLVPGAIYYLGLAGTITTTAPTADGYYVVKIGRAQSVSKLDIEIGPVIRL